MEPAPSSSPVADEHQTPQDFRQRVTGHCQLQQQPDQHVAKTTQCLPDVVQPQR